MENAAGSRCPRGLLGMLALVAAIELTLSSRALRFADTASLNWRLSAEDISREAARCEVACLGDSLMKIGVLPEVIRVGTGKRAYNFAMARAPSPMTYFALRRLLDAGGRPSALLVEFKPSLLALGPRSALRHYQEILTLRESWDLARNSGTLKLFPQIVFGQILPSVRYRLEVREAVLSALKGELAPVAEINRVVRRNWSANRGAHLNRSWPAFPGPISEQIHEWFRSDRWECHRLNRLYLDRLFDLVKSRGIPVYWVIPPLPPELQSRRERSGVDRRYVDFVRSMQASHPEITVVDGRRAGYGNAAFADHTHLNGLGSITLSHELAVILKRPGIPSRWVELPRYRNWPIDAPMEDIDQSRIALGVEAMRR